MVGMTVKGQDAAAAFNEANRLFEQQNYAGAAAAYEKMLQRDQKSAAVYFNLGNARFKAGEVGRAIAAYREAERLAPRDPDVQANLQFAREQLQNTKAPPSNLFTSLLDRLTLNEWAVLTATLLWLWFLLLAFGQLKSDWRKPLRRYAIGLGVLAICFLGCTGFAAQRHLVKSAVVTVQEAVVRRGPFEESQSAFALRDGSELTVLDKRDNWLQIADTSNRVGWIADNQVAIIH